MAITATGNSYTTGDQVTAATQNAQVNAATFVTGSVDNSTTQLSGGAIIVKDGGITPAKLSVGHPTWDTSSRVGIGTASPSYKLDVNGDAGINGDTYISAGTASRTAVAFANPVSSLCPELRMTRQGASTSTNDFIKLDTSSGEVVSIDASGGAFFAGRVGIGTASPGYKLTVSEASTDFAALINNSTSSGNGLKINAGDNSGDRVLELNDKDGTSLMQVGATGNLTLNIGDLIISALTTPASASATGTVGTVAWDTNYFYVCTATNTWKRSGLSSW